MRLGREVGAARGGAFRWPDPAETVTCAFAIVPTRDVPLPAAAVSCATSPIQPLPMVEMGAKQGAMKQRAMKLTSAAFRHRLAVSLTIALSIAILWLTLRPQTLPDFGTLPLDKIAHLIAFAALILPTAWLYPRALVVTLPLAVVLGASIELLQPLVGRGRELADFLMDLVGLGLGIVLGGVLRWLARDTARG